MSENRFPWRDIYSVGAWKKILEITHSTINQDLSKLTRLIESYHHIEKDKIEGLAARRLGLQAVEDEAGALIERKNIRTEKGAKKYDNRGAGAYISDPGPWLASLQGRCWKKIDYLLTIEEYEKNNRNSQYSKTAASYLRYLTKVQQRRAKDTNMHLTAGNRLERLDPLHRGGAELELFADNYIQSTSNPLSKALHDWLDSDSTTPFFLWLENHPVCLASPGLDNIWDESFRTVKRPRIHVMLRKSMRLRWLPGGLCQFPQIPKRAGQRSSSTPQTPE